MRIITKKTETRVSKFGARDELVTPWRECGLPKFMIAGLDWTESMG